MYKLHDVKVGDVLFVASSNGMSGGTFYPVERLTKTRVFCNRGYVFRINDGGLVGQSSSWRRAWARKATPHDFEQEKMRNRIHRARMKLETFRVNAENVELVESMFERLVPKEPADAAQ